MCRLKSDGSEVKKEKGEEDKEEADAADKIDYEKLMEYFGEVQSKKKLEKSYYEMRKRKVMQTFKKPFNDDGLTHDF